MQGYRSAPAGPSDKEFVIPKCDLRIAFNDLRL